MRLPSAQTWLVDEAVSTEGADQFLTILGSRLIADGLPLAGGALTQSAPHPIIARRTWLWRADSGAVLEALGFGFSATAVEADVGRDWLADLGVVHDSDIGAPAIASATLGWASHRPLNDGEAAHLNQVARFAAAPLAAIAARSTLAALLETYLGRRSASQVLSGRLRREAGEAIRAVLLYADLRGFTELSETVEPKQVVAALDGWFDRIAGAAHAFGGEVLKFIGDGVLAIFPVDDRGPADVCQAALRAVAAARAGMTHLDQERIGQGLPPLPFGLALHIGEMLWGNIGTADRLDFTAIGRDVNLVSRLEGLCRPLGHDVLVSGAFAAHSATSLIPLGEHRLRGIAAPCTAFALPR